MSAADERLRLVVRGLVQGVGFRPFVYNLATQLQLRGWVNNSNQGLAIELEGPRSQLDSFLLRLQSDHPPHAAIHGVEPTWLEPNGYSHFAIRPSDESGPVTALVLPDIAACAACLREVLDPKDRRYLYPFANCTHCGPRYTIIESLPYDRAHTSMKAFALCDTCQSEYEDPSNRRFHAQPNACPLCGPHLELWDGTGQVLSRYHDALLAAASALRDGAIVAVKGLGGFHLLVDAHSQEAVCRLRQRKNRAEKPFALLYPDLDSIQTDCYVSPLEARLLGSPEAPITLLVRRANGALATAVAPQSPSIGAMLPNTPLHHLLMRQIGRAVVATSGNLAEEPICIDEREALAKLGTIADFFLVHDRPICRPVDDSIVRLVAEREMVLRRARGYAPLPVQLSTPVEPLIAVGAHLKSTIAVAAGQHAFISQHIGDLETRAAFAHFCRSATDLQKICAISPQRVLCDQHPDYLSTRYARQSGLPVTTVQHHHAHALACMAENHVDGPALGVCWDGTGYSSDGTIWGGEFLLLDGDSFHRFAHLRTFALPGGDSAAREPRRAAIGLLYEIWGAALFSRSDIAPLRTFSSVQKPILQRVLERHINAPLTSSAGRLFDAVAALLDIQQHNNYEGQAAMALEAAAQESCDESYALAIEQTATGAYIVNWQPLITQLLNDIKTGAPIAIMAARFHNGLAESIVQIAQRAARDQVVLSGGCMQNKYLCERSIARLRSAGFTPFWPQRIPANDGGIALGQVAAFAQSNQRAP